MLYRFASTAAPVVRFSHYTFAMLIANSDLLVDLLVNGSISALGHTLLAGELVDLCSSRVSLRSMCT